MKKKKKKLQGGGPSPKVPSTLDNIIPSYVADPSFSNNQPPTLWDKLTGNTTLPFANDNFRISARQQGDWMSSPMYKQMLYNSLKGMNNFSDEQITAFQNARLQNLNTMPSSVKFYEPEKRPGTGGFSVNDTGEVYQAKSYDDEGQEYLPLSWMRTSLYPHEISHSVDRPLKRNYKNRFLNAQLDGLGSMFPNLNSQQRLIPDSDIGLMRSSLIATQENSEGVRDQQPGHVPIEFWRDYGNTPEEGAYNYFTSPTEVRARLMELRTQGRYRDIYNPGHDKVDEAIYDKLPSDTKAQLEAYFTKDGIINMLNTISDTDAIDTNIGMAATGGQVKKMQAGGPAPNEKNTTPVDQKLNPIERAASIISGYTTLKNDPLSKYNLNRFKNNPEFTNPYMNEKVDTPQDVSAANFGFPTMLEEGDPGYTPPIIPISPDEMITPDAFATDNIILREPNTTFLTGGAGRADFNAGATLAKRKGTEAGRSGRVILEDGTKVDFNDPESGYRFDNATWQERIWGEDQNGSMFKRTYGYEDFIRESMGDGNSSDLIKFMEENGEYQGQLKRIENRAQESREGLLRPIKGMDISGYFYKEKGYYPVFDEEEGQWYLQETSLSEEEFKKVRGALLSPYGVGQVQKGTLHSFADGFSESLGTTWESLVNFAEMTGDAFDGVDSDNSPDGFVDKLAASARTATEFNKYAKTAMQQTDSMFSNGDAIGNGLGSGLASLLSFWGLGGVGGATVKGAGKLITRKLLMKNPVKSASMIGHLSGGMPLNAGEVYSMAKKDGIDEDDAAQLALTVGFINTLIEYGVGTNALANRAMGVYGSRGITKAILEYAKKTGMRLNNKQALDQATPYILRKVYKFLEKGDDFLNSPFRFLENVGVKSAGKYGTNLLTRTTRAVGSGLEEGTEEFIQGSIIDLATKTYNNLIAGEDGKVQGKGMFDVSPYDPKKLLEEAAIGFILGGSTRFITGSQREAGVMGLIAQGYGQEMLNQIDHLGGMNLLGKYQTKKLKKRINDLNNTWKANEVAFSHLSPEGQFIVGRNLLYDLNFKERLKTLNNRKSKLEADETLTEPEKQKRLDKLKAEEIALNNLKNVNDTLLEYFSDPNLTKQYKLESIPNDIIQGARQLALQKAKSEYQKQKIEELYNSLQAGKKRKFTRLLNKLRKDPAFKDIVEGLEVTQADQDSKEAEAYDKLIKKLDDNIKQHEDKINELLTSPDTWSQYEKEIKESMKTEEESINDQEAPIKQKDPNETNVQKREREARVKAQQQADAKNKAIGKALDIEGVPVTHIQYGNKKVGEVLEIIEEGGKKIYVLKQKDKNGKNIKVPEDKVKGKMLSPVVDETNDTRHRARFNQTYWRNVVAIPSMGTLTQKQLDKLLTDNNNSDLIKNIQVEFVFVPRELNKDTAQQNEFIDVNLNGSYFQLRDKRTKQLLGVVRSSNRFYDKQGTWIPGDKFTKDFFNKNFRKTGKPFTDKEFEEFKNNYKLLDDALNKFEALFPNATIDNPQVLKNSLFSFEFSGRPKSNNNEDRISIDNATSPHTFDGDYILYDRHEGKVILGPNPSQELMKKLPGDEFQGRYFALVKRGLIPNWVRIFPKKVDEKAVAKRLQTLKKEISLLNRQIKAGVKLNYNQELDAINKKLNMFIAIKGYQIYARADFVKKDNSYQLSIFGQRAVNGQYETIIPNVRLKNNASVQTIIDTINNYTKNIEGAPQISIKSFKESIPNDGSEVTPDLFESSLMPGATWDYPTMTLGFSNDIYTLQEPTFTEEIIVEEISLEEKDSYTAEELEKQLRKDLGDEMANLDVEGLNNGVRLDIESQLFAQLLDGPMTSSKVDILQTILGQTEIPIETTLDDLLNRYIEGITIKSFVPNKTYTKEEYAQIREKARFALRQKSILESPEFDRSSLFDKIKEKYKYMAAEATILSENWDMDHTEMGSIESLPARVKLFISLLTTPATDIFGRTTWQSEKYETTQILKTLDGHTLAGRLMMMLSNQTNEGNIMARLEAVAEYDPQIRQVKIALDNNPGFIPGFVNAFNKFELGYLKVLTDFTSIDKSSTSVQDPVTSTAANQILNNWYSKSVGINIKTKNAAIKEIKSYLDQEDSAYLNTENLVKAFDKLGWTITPTAAAYMLGDQALRDAYPELMFNELGNFKGVIPKLNNYNKKQTSLSQDHPLYKMATIAAIFDPTTYEANYRDADGKSRYRYIPRNSYMELARELKEGKLNDRFTLLPNNLLKDNVSGIEIKMAGDFVQKIARVNLLQRDLKFDSDTATNKTLDDEQRILLMFSLFLNEEIEGHGYYVPHVIESKKALYALRLPKKQYYNGGITQLAIDDTYNSLFIREFERNLTEEGKLDGGQYFGILSILENMEITGINGEQQTVPKFLEGRKTLDGLESFIKENIIKPALQENITDLQERISEFDSTNLSQKIDKIVIEGPSVGNYIDKVGNIALNYFIMGNNYTQLVLRDDNFKNDVDFNKRLAGPNAAGLKKGNINFKYLMIEDDIVPEEEAFGVKDSASNDAQVIITLPMYAARELEASNYTSETQRAILEKLRDSLDDPSIVVTNAEINALDLNSTKTVYEDLNRYFKKSDFILTKQVAEQQAAAGNPQLLNIYNKLNNNKIMYLIAQSASKRKSDKGVSADFFNTDQDVNLELVNEGSMKYERDQVVNKTKSKYGIESYATVAKQLHDLIGSVVQGNDRQIVDIINRSNAENKKIFNEIVTSIVSDPDNSDLLKAIIIENNRGRRNDNTLKLFQDGNYNLTHVSNLVRTSILNLYNRDALNSKSVGSQATLISGTHFVNPQTGEALKIHRNVNGTIEYAEILASRKMFNLNEFSNIKDVPAKLLTAFGVRIPVQAHHSMIPLKVVGFLPDANGDSIVTPKQLPALAGSDYDLDKLYLHRYASIINEQGQRVVLPAKPTLAQYKQYWSENQYVRQAQEVYGIGPTEAMQRLGIINEEGTAAYDHPLALQNNMLDNMLALFNTAEVQEVMFQPATKGKAEDFVKKYGEVETKKSIFTITGILDYHAQNAMGRDNVGIGANANSAYSIITQFAEDLDIKPVNVTIDGKTYDNYGIVKEDDVNDKLELEEGVRSKFDSMSSIITLFVDNVKLGLAPQVNLSADMSVAATDLIALGVGQMRTLMIINQPILKYYTRDQQLTKAPKNLPFSEQKSYHFDKLQDLLKRIKSAPLTTAALDKHLKSKIIFTDVLDKIKNNNIGLTNAEMEYMQIQKAVLDITSNIVTGGTAKTIRDITLMLSTVSGLDQKFVQNTPKSNKRRGNLTKTLGQMKGLRNIHPVYENSKTVLDNINNILDETFLKIEDVYKVFVGEYGNTTKEDASRIINRIEALKKIPKYKDNIALHTLLRISNGELIADTQTKMSPEIEGLLIGNFEDLFQDNQGLDEDLLRYAFGTTKLAFANNSFVKYLPASVFSKFSKALDKAQETGVIPTEKPKFLKKGPVIPEQPIKEEVEDTLETGEYTPLRMSNELNLTKFNILINNLQKAGVKVIYDPYAGHSGYSQGRITLNKLSKSLFLEEALHAGLDILPKGQKVRLRKQVLAWYKQLVNNHADTSKKTQKIFNRYVKHYNNEEQAAEELITHLIYKDEGLIDELNNLKSPNEQGILESVWSKFIKLISSILGIKVKEGSELQELSRLLTPVDRLMTTDYEYTNFSQERMFNLPAGRSSMFDSIAVNTTAENASKLLVNEDFAQMIFNGEAMPILESIVNMMEGNKVRGKAVIVKKKTYGRFTEVVKQKQAESLAKELGYESLADWKKNGTKQEQEYIQGFKDSATVLSFEAYMPETTDDLIKMNSVDKDRNVTNNVLLLLNKQLQAIKGGNVKNTAFVKNRVARIEKIIKDVELAEDVFNSIDDFYDDVTSQSELLKTYLNKDRSVEDLIDGLTKYRILLEDMAFINELPEAFKNKLQTTKYKDSEKMLKKLQEAVTLLEDMKTQLRKEYIPILANKLYPMIKKSGVETKKFLDINLADRNAQIKKVLDKMEAGELSEEKGRAKIRRLKGAVKKFQRLAEQAPQSEADFENFLLYSTHDMDWLGYMFMAPSTTSDPGLAGLVNYTASLAIEARREAINISNVLEDAENILKAAITEEGGTISNNPKILYEKLIEKKNHRNTGNKDVWTLVTKYDIAAFEKALEIAELKIASDSNLMQKLRLEYYKNLDSEIEKIKAQIQGYKIQDDKEGAADIISDLETRLIRLETQRKGRPEEKDLIRIQLRKNKWYRNNQQAKTEDEIRDIMKRVSDVREWSKSQMNPAARYKLGIITKSEFDMIQSVESSVNGFKNDTPVYYGYQVTRPNNKYINKKWSALYNKNDQAKNKFGEAHAKFTEIYKDALAKVYKKQSVDMALPSLRKGFFDRILDKKGTEGVKEEWKRLFRVDEDDAFVYGYAAMQNQTRNYAPVYFMEDIDADEVSLDIKGSLMVFANAAIRTEQNNEVLKLAYMLRDTYNQNRIVDPTKPDIVGIRKLGKKIASVQQGQSYVAARLEKYIEMVLLGKTKNVSYIPGTKIQIDKVVDNLLGYTAITTLGLDFLKGGRNFLTALWQQGIEAGASEANKGKISLSEFIEAHKIMSSNFKNLMSDGLYKLGNRSYLGQLLLYFDAIQGEFDGFGSGKQTTGNTLLRQTLLNPDNLLINYHIGEVAAQGAAAVALLKKRKVTVNGEEVGLYDAFRVNKKTGAFEFRGTEAEKKAAQETIRTTTLEIAEMNRRLNGNYTTAGKAVAEQNVIGRMFLLFRKFLVPTVMNRWRVDFVNHEKGEPDGGFYRRAINNMWNAWKTSTEGDLIKRALDTKRRSTLTPQDKEAVMKTLYEATILAILSALVSILMGMQDDDDEEISVPAYYLLYLLTTTRAEIMAFSPLLHKSAPEALRILRSPTAMSTSIERTLRLIYQLGAPFEEYQRTTGPWEKGENKLKVRALQWLGVSKLQTDPETALRNFLMITER